MKLVVIAAVIAVCGGAKLDRTYLPPASAKSAGGSPGSLQTPFAGNSFNNGLGGLPKGSYSNDFQGVVVDAAVGTRTSEGDSGLGAPRAAYGSANSKVGEAAFRPTFGAGFRHTDADGSLGDHQDSFNGNQHSFGDNHADGIAAGSHAAPERPERPQAVLERAANTIRLESEVGPENYHYAYETDNGIYAEENAVATNGVQAQGGYSYTADDGQVYSVTYTADEGGYQPKGDHLPTPPPIPEEILKSLELNAQEEAAGIVDDGSYDAQKYNAGGDYSQSDNANNQYNERQSSKGKPVNRHESDAVTSGSFINQSNQPFRRPNESSASNGPNEIPEQNVHKQDGNVQKPTSSNGFGSSNRFTSIAQAQSGPLDSGIKNQKPAFGNGFGSSNRFAANGQTGQVSNAASGNGYNSNNEYLLPGNSRPVNLNRKPKPEELELSTDTSAAPSFNQEYNAKPQSSAPESQAFPKGQSNGQYQSQTAESNAAFGSPSNRPTSISSPSNLNKDGFNHIGNNNVNKKEVSSHSSQNSNEYLPPQNSFNRPANQGLRPQQNQPVNSVGSGFNVKSASSDQKNTQPGENFGKFSSASASFTSNGHQPSEQLTNSNINGQRYQQPGNNVAPSYNTFNSQKSTIQPQTELTTPFESNEKPSNKDHSFEGAYQTTRKPTSLSLQPLNNNPSQSQFISQSADQSQAISSASTAVRPRPQISQSQSFSHAQNPNSVNPARLPQIPGQFQSFGNKQRPSQNQAAPEDAQIAASTIRPSITPAFVQRQGQDDSYYYNQPARPFNTPQSQTQGSRFPNTPSNNFNNLNRQGFTTQSNSQYSSVPQFGSAQSSQTDLSQTSPKYPQESDLASVAPTSANKQISAESSAQFGPQSTRFQSPQNSFSQGSSRYPQPPSLLPVGSTSPTKKESSSPVNGVTQASASPFGGSPTPSTSFNNKQFGQFSSRPSNQNQFSHSSSQQLSQESPLPSNRPSSQLQSNSPNQFNQKLASQSQSQSFGQRPSSQQPSAQRPFSQRPSGQPSGNAQPEPSDNSPAVATQQYSGQIYEYNKPSQILPAPAHKEPSASSSQFGQKVNSQPSQSHPDQPQGSDDSINSASSQNTVQANQPFAGQSPRPQFGAQPSKPQFGVQPSKPQFAQPSRPQFSAQASSQFNAQPSRPQFVTQSSFSSNAAAQEENSPVLGSHLQVNQDQRQQNSCCGQKHIGQDSSAQPTQASAFASINGQGSSEATAEMNNGFAQGPSFRPEQAGSQSFAGRGEQFGGPRVPPSFDEKTGYHY